MKIKRMGAVFFLVVCVFCGCGNMKYLTKKTGRTYQKNTEGQWKRQKQHPTGRIRSL